MALGTKVKKIVRALLLTVQDFVCKEVLVLGDSHTRVFDIARLRLRLWRYRLRVVRVNGATASGLENPNSKTQAFQKFEAALEKTRADRVIVMLGEVDAGFVIWYRATKQGIPVTKSLEQTLKTYGAFLKSIQVRGLRPVCISAPLPTIEDDNSWGEVANLRRSVTATQRQRTELTLSLNQKMAAFCHAEGIAHLSFDDASLGRDGLVKPTLLNRNRLDHHYNKRAYVNLLASPVVKTLRQE